jgi:tRNA threonylcarbamoyladenosine biosynthesis protein TsaE
MTSVTLSISDENAMLALGAKLAGASHFPATIFLMGPLGAGKTTFSRGFLRGLGFEGKVKSPTYTIVEPYELDKHRLYHFDLYRVKDPLELEYLGIQDYFSENAICLIEWPEYGEGVLPKADLSCHIDLESEGRHVKLVAHSAQGQHILQRFKDHE